MRYLYDALEDTATDVDITSEGALLVDVLKSEGFFGGLEAETDVFPPSDGFVVGLLEDALAGALEDSRLLLVSPFDLKQVYRFKVSNHPTRNKRNKLLQVK